MPDKTKTFTQLELDELIEGRIARERRDKGGRMLAMTAERDALRLEVDRLRAELERLRLVPRLVPRPAPRPRLAERLDTWIRRYQKGSTP